MEIKDIKLDNIKIHNIYWAPVLSFLVPGLGQVSRLRFLQGYSFFISFFLLAYFTCFTYFFNLALGITPDIILRCLILLILHIVNVIDAVYDLF